MGIQPFIGSHLVDALFRENEVRIIDDVSTGNRAYCYDEAIVFDDDIREDDQLAVATAGVDLVFREAALVSVDECRSRSPWRPRESMLWLMFAKPVAQFAVAQG